MTSKQLAQWCAWHASNRKAENIVILDVSKLSSITDYFVIVSGTSEPHLRAIKDEILDRMREDFGIKPRAEDGAMRAPWHVLDFFDVMVHVFHPEARGHYDLEGLWNDAPRITPRKPAGPKSKQAKT